MTFVETRENPEAQKKKKNENREDKLFKVDVSTPSEQVNIRKRIGKGGKARKGGRTTLGELN